MNGEAFVATIETELTTELTRLGSQKLLLALTGADLTQAAVLRVVVTDATAARELYETWAADGTAEPLESAVAAAADRERARLDRLGKTFDIDSGETDAHPSIYEPLRAYTDPIEQAAGGLVALPMVRTRMYTQVVGFFINEAAPGPTDVFRELKAETRTAVTEGADLLETVCVEDSDWETARMAAETTITAAYEDYAETLEGMGIDPRPIC